MATKLSQAGISANRVIFSNNDLTLASGSQPNDSYVRSVATLKAATLQYFEWRNDIVGATDEMQMGFASASAPQTSWIGSSNQSIGYTAGTGNVYFNNGTLATFGAPIVGTRMCGAISKSGKYFFSTISTSGVRGLWNNSASADPVADIGGFTGPVATTAACAVNSSGQKGTAYFDANTWLVPLAGAEEIGGNSVATANASATQSLAIGQAASATVSVKASAIQALGIQQDASASVPLAPPVSHASADQSLAIGQVATVAVVAALTVQQSLAIGQAASLAAVVSVSAAQSLFIGQEASALAPLNAQAIQSLGIGQDAAAALGANPVAMPANLSASQALSIQQIAAVHSNRNAHATQALGIGQVASATVKAGSTAHNLHAGQSLAIGQVARATNSTPRGTLRSHILGLDPIDLVSLFVVMAPTGTLRFTPTRRPDGRPILWRGQEYTSYPCSASGFEMSAAGTMPRPVFSFSNITGALGDFINSQPNDMLGSTIERHRTLKRYLDGEPGANPAIEWPVDSWIVARKTKEDAMTIDFECATMFDLEGIQIPGRQVLAGLCMFIYRGSECGYTGPPVQDINGNYTANPAMDRCKKTLDACTARFGYKGPLPTSAFPASLLQVDAS